MEGSLISLEGGEGSGKTTQIKLLSDRLQKLGYQIVSTKEPGGTSIGKKVRRLLLDPGNKEMDARTEFLLYAADRAQHIKEKIKPALKEGKIVLTDRYVDSNIAYQGYGRGLDKKMLKQINEWIIGDYWPDLTIILDIEIEEGIERARNLSAEKTGDRLEQEILDFYHSIREAFIKMAAAKPERFVLIDADKNSQAVHEEIFAIVNERLL